MIVVLIVAIGAQATFFMTTRIPHNTFIRMAGVYMGADGILLPPKSPRAAILEPVLRGCRWSRHEEGTKW